MLKKRQVVMLPAKPNDKLQQDLIKCIKSFKDYDGDSVIDEGVEGTLSIGISKQMDTDVFEAQHLYFTAQDEEIKEDEYCYNYKRNTLELTRVMKDTSEWVFCRKIVATTNPAVYVYSPAVIGSDFIEEFVKAQGNIKEVMLEYYETPDWNKVLNSQPYTGTEIQRLVLKKAGQIVWHPVEQKQYTRDELHDALQGYHKYCNGGHMSWAETAELKQWIDRNYPE